MQLEFFNRSTFISCHSIGFLRARCIVIFRELCQICKYLFLKNNTCVARVVSFLRCLIPRPAIKTDLKWSAGSLQVVRSVYSLSLFTHSIRYPFFPIIEPSGSLVTKLDIMLMFTFANLHDSMAIAITYWYMYDLFLALLRLSITCGL